MLVRLENAALAGARVISLVGQQHAAPVAIVAVLLHERLKRRLEIKVRQEERVTANHQQVVVNVKMVACQLDGGHGPGAILKAGQGWGLRWKKRSNGAAVLFVRFLHTSFVVEPSETRSTGVCELSYCWRHTSNMRWL